MKATFNRDLLLAACQLAAPACGRESVKPVLQNLKLSVAGNDSHIAATDCEIGVRVPIDPMDQFGVFGTLLPAERLQKILRECDGETVVISPSGKTATIANGKTATIVCGSASFDLPADDVASFPDFPSEIRSDFYLINADKLAWAIKRTEFAVAPTEHSKFRATTGVCFELSDTTISLVATDGRRLAVATVAAETRGENAAKTPVLPAKAIRLLCRHLVGKPVKVAFRQNEAIIDTGRSTIYTRLVEGRFPTYRQVIPKDLSHSVMFTTDSLAQAVRQAAIMTDDESKSVALQFENRLLRLSSSSASAGRSQISLAVDSYAKVKIGFDPKFIIDALQAVDEEVEMRFTDEKVPVIFTDCDDWVCVVVPLILGGK